MKIWNDKEVASLFKSVENCKAQKKSLKFAFEEHAKKFKRKPNSVRNYYYKEVDNLATDKVRCQRLNIKIENHTKNHFVCFEKEECQNVLQEIEKFTQEGMSVRSACFKLANGDLAQMTRLQNKYQNMKKNNVIQFRQRQKMLSDNEINSLFLGLVRLIKKNAIEEYCKENQNENTQKLMKKAFDDLNEKDSQILKLKKDFQQLKQENQELLARLKLYEKNQALKEHLKKKHISKLQEN